MPRYPDNHTKPPVILHSPKAGPLRYEFDWSEWLTAEGTTISGVALTVPDGLTNDGSLTTSTKVQVDISGGTVGNDYQVICDVTLANGQSDARSVVLRCVER